MAAKYNFRKTLKLFRYMIVGLFLFMLTVAAIMFFGRMENTVTGRGTCEGFQEYQLKSTVASRIKQVLKKEEKKLKKAMCFCSLMIVTCVKKLHCSKIK